MARISDKFDNLGADGSPVRLGLLGGTFDPVHFGHLRIAEEVREELALDAVLFIPAGNPVFKRDQRIADAAHRVEMCRLATASNPFFDVCTVEVDRAGDTFTVDTLRELRAHYPENVEFYFIVGSDAAMSVWKWRDVRDVAALAHLVVAAGRPGSATVDELRESVESAAPFRLHVVETSVLEISSSDIRERMSQGLSVRYLLPASVRAYAAGRSIYAQPGEAASSGEPAADQTAADEAMRPDPLTKEYLKARRAELEGRVSPKRFEHCLGVSQACVKLAKHYGVDVKKARLAGLLHDWDKGMDDEQARARVHELGMEGDVDPWVVEHMPRVLHSYTAARALARDYPEIPADVLQAIDRHTTAALDMSPLDMVLYIADAIEPGRKYGRIDELRAAVGKVSLEELYFETYEYWTFLLFERKKTLHPDTMRIWNANVLRREALEGRDGAR